MATRDAEDPTSAKVEWAGVACATRYNVSVFVDGKDSVDVVPATDTTYALSSLNPTKTYRIQVSSRNDAGVGTSSSVFYLRPATPGSVSAMKVSYSDVKGAVLSWKAPVERVPSHYLLAVTRVADQKLVTEAKIAGDLTDYAPHRRRCPRHVRHHPPGRSTRPATARSRASSSATRTPIPVKSVAAIRDPGNAKQVIVSWLPSDNTLKGTVIGYEIAYGHARADERVVVKDTDSEVTVPGDKSVVVIVRVLTDRGKSRWSQAVRVPMTDSVKTNTTDQRIDLVDQDGVISVAATQAVAANNRLVVKVVPTANNGGFTETQYSQNGAQVMTFRKVPEGSYLVTVENEEPRDGPPLHQRRQRRQDVRRRLEARTSARRPSRATRSTCGTGPRPGSSPPAPSPRQDMVLASKAQLRSGRATGSGSAPPAWRRTR